MVGSEREWQENTPTTRVIKRKLYPEDPRKVRARYLKWKLAHPDKVKEHSKKYAAGHRDVINKAARLWRKANPERCAEYSVGSRDRRRGKISEYARQYAKDHPERRSANETARRARKLGAPGRYSPDDVSSLKQKQGGKCGNLACRVVLREYHVDHVMPLSKGGSNWPENLQLLCPTCNVRKQAQSPEKWASRNGLLFC